MGILVTSAVMAVIGALQIGINSDEPVHVLRLASWFDNGWYLPWFYLDGDRPATTVTDTYVYAPVAMLIGHAAAVLFRIESWGDITGSPEAYAVRHLTFVAHGVVGVVATGLTVRVITSSWRWGVVGASILAAIPLWTGHAMFNIKDTPVAAGVSLVTLSLVVMSRRRFDTSGKIRAGAAGTFAAGMFLAMGTRPGIWPVLAVGSVVLLFATSWERLKLDGQRAARSAVAARLLALVTASTVAFASLALIAPRTFSSPLRLLRSSVAESADFVAWDGWILTAGLGHGTPPPWWYLPVWISHQIPLFILLFACAGGGAIVVAGVLGQLRGGTAAPSTLVPIPGAALAGLVVVVAMAGAAPTAAVVTAARLQSGVRQLLFVIPTVAVLAAVGAWVISLALSARSSPSTQRWSAVSHIVLALALVVPVIDQIRLFPYNYTYFNEIATLREINGRWATDYLRVSFREAAAAVAGDGDALCGAHSRFEEAPTAAPVDLERSRGFWSCHSFASFGAFADEAEHRSSSAEIDQDQFWLVRENQFGHNVPSNCRLTDAVTRPLRHRTVMMSYIAVCDPLRSDD